MFVHRSVTGYWAVAGGAVLQLVVAVGSSQRSVWKRHGTKRNSLAFSSLGKRMAGQTLPCHQAPAESAHRGCAVEHGGSKEDKLRDLEGTLERSDVLQCGEHVEARWAEWDGGQEEVDE
jgi:hypothetical protein